MAGASLLTRLAHAADPHATERHTHRDEDVERAVVQHVRQILNTRQGSSLTCPDYGLIEVSEVLHDFPDAVGLIQRAIKACIQTYEPRLKNVQVRHVKDGGSSVAGMSLEFEILGQIQLEGGRRQPLRFATSVDPSGNVDLVE